MANLQTKYLGLTLKNPVVVSSSGLTGSIDKIKEAEKNGAAAIVLKSVFEEQINYEAADIHSKGADSAEAFDYVQQYITANNLENYLKLISEAKKSVTIPIIASVNCYSDKKWIDFTQRFQEAGADALELNIYIMPADRKPSGGDIEKKYYSIVKRVVKKSTIPVSVKLSYHFTNVVNVVDNLKSVGASGVVLFNRFYEPDIDIENMSITNSHVFSDESDIRFSLRWAAIVSDAVKGIDIATSTGVHDARGAIKLILAGADAVQVCSLFYQKGFGQIQKILDGIESWMAQRGFDSVAAFKGIMSYKSIPEPEVYQRAQFMKYFSNFE